MAVGTPPVEPPAGSAHRFQDIVELASEGIVMVDAGGAITFANPRMHAMLGYPPGALHGHQASQFVVLGFPEGTDQGEGVPVSIEPSKASPYRLIHRNGQTVHVLISATNIVDDEGDYGGSIAMITDVTERKQQELQLIAALAEQRELNKKLEDAQNQLLQSEKMASLGQLAAGVAHELNNPIGFIQSNLTTLEQYLQEIFAVTDAYAQAETADGITAAVLIEVQRLKQDADFKFLQEDIGLLIRESMDGIDRVTKIVRDLKDFSRVGEANWQWADIHDGIESTLNIVRNELKYKCQVIKHYAPLPKIYCLPSQLNQVTMNLLVNAAHAIPERGDIVITTRMAGPESVQLLVSDSGNGIPPEIVHRIFEPFFTTKGIGKGTGLGLSIAYGIIARHGGRIEVDSQVGRGTTFTITLPVRPPNTILDRVGDGSGTGSE